MFVRVELFGHYLEIGRQEPAAEEPEQPAVIVDTQFPIAIHDQQADPVAERLWAWPDEEP